MPEVRGLGQSLIIPTKLMRHETEELMTWKLVLREAIYLAGISLLLAGVYNELIRYRIGGWPLGFGPACLPGDGRKSVDVSWFGSWAGRY